MTIDNFDLIRKHLTFVKAVRSDGKPINDTFDRYIIHIIKRAKDNGGKNFGSNESQRLIKTFEVGSLEYYDKKIDTIKELCLSNGARAYILPQVRSTKDCLLSLMKLAIDGLENPTIKFQHIIRNALCKTHKSRNKIFIFDMDSDRYDVSKSEMYLSTIKSLLKEIGKNEEDAYIVPTKSGCHIVSTAFNKIKFGEIHKEVDLNDIVSDNMTLLYYSDENNVL